MFYSPILILEVYISRIFQIPDYIYRKESSYEILETEFPKLSKNEN